MPSSGPAPLIRLAKEYFPITLADSVSLPCSGRPSNDCKGPDIYHHYHEYVQNLHDELGFFESTKDLTDAIAKCADRQGVPEGSIVRVFKDEKEAKQEFVMVEELDRVLGLPVKPRSPMDNWATMDISAACVKAAKHQENVRFENTPIIRTRLRAAPISAPDGSSCKLAVDVLIELFRDLLFGLNVFRKAQAKDEFFMVVQFMKTIEKYFPQSKSDQYFISAEKIQFITNLAQRHFASFENVEVVNLHAYIHTKAKSNQDILGVADLLEATQFEECFEGIVDAAGDVEEYYESEEREKLFPVHSVQGVEDLVFISVFKEFQQFTLFLHKQNGCSLLAGTNCCKRSKMGVADILVELKPFYEKSYTRVPEPPVTLETTDPLTNMFPDSLLSLARNYFPFLPEPLVSDCKDTPLLAEKLHKALPFFNTMEDMIDALQTYQSFPGSSQNLGTSMCGAYTTREVVYKGIFGNYIFKNDFFLFLYRCTLHVFPETKDIGPATIIGLFLKRQEQRLCDTLSIIPFSEYFVNTMIRELRRCKDKMCDPDEPKPAYQSKFDDILKEYKFLACDWESEDYKPLKNVLRSAHRKNVELSNEWLKLCKNVLKVLKQFIDECPLLWPDAKLPEEDRPAFVRVFKDKEIGMEFVMKEELDRALGETNQERNPLDNWEVVTRKVALEQKIYRNANFEFLNVPIARTRLRAVPIATPGGKFCKLAIDVLYELLRHLYYGGVIQKVSKDTRLLAEFFEKIEVYFPPLVKDTPFFITGDQIEVITRLADDHFSEIATRKAPSFLDCFKSVQQYDTKFFLLHLGFHKDDGIHRIAVNIEHYFPRPHHHEILHVAEHCVWIQLCHDYPNLVKFFHEQRECSRMYATTCCNESRIAMLGVRAPWCGSRKPRRFEPTTSKSTLIDPINQVFASSFLALAKDHYPADLAATVKCDECKNAESSSNHHTFTHLKKLHTDLQLFVSPDHMVFEMQMYRAFPGAQRILGTSICEAYSANGFGYFNMKDKKYMFKNFIFVFIQDFVFELFPDMQELGPATLLGLFLRLYENQLDDNLDFIPLDHSELKEQVKKPLLDMFKTDLNLRIAKRQKIPKKLSLADVKKLIPGQWDSEAYKSLESLVNKAVKGNDKNMQMCSLLLPTIAKFIEERGFYRADTTPSKFVRWFFHSKGLISNELVKKEVDNGFVIKDELDRAMGRDVPKRGPMEIVETIPGKKYLKNETKLGLMFLKTQIEVNGLRTVPIRIPGWTYCKPAVDVLFELLQEMILGLHVFQKIHEGNFQLLVKFVKEIEPEFPKERKDRYLMTAAKIESLNQKAKSHFAKLKERPGTKKFHEYFSQVKEVKGTMHDLQELGILKSFPDTSKMEHWTQMMDSMILKVAKEVYPCDLILNAQICIVQQFVEQFPQFATFVHNQDGCYRLIETECCKKEVTIVDAEELPKLKRVEEELKGKATVKVPVNGSIVDKMILELNRIHL